MAGEDGDMERWIFLIHDHTGLQMRFDKFCWRVLPRLNWVGSRPVSFADARRTLQSYQSRWVFLFSNLFSPSDLWYLHRRWQACGHVNCCGLKMTLCQFVSREDGQNTNILEVWYQNGRRRLLGAQSINTERASYKLILLSRKTCAFLRVLRPHH